MLCESFFSLLERFFSAVGEMCSCCTVSAMLNRTAFASVLVAAAVVTAPASGFEVPRAGAPGCGERQSESNGKGPANSGGNAGSLGRRADAPRARRRDRPPFESCGRRVDCAGRRPANVFEVLL